MEDRVFVSASPSLALVKYWGKADAVRNLPATASVGITLAGLETRSAVAAYRRGAPQSPPQHAVSLNGVAQKLERFAPFLDNLRDILATDAVFEVESYNTFPTAAGLASSSSGFAALAAGCAWAAGLDPDQATLSRLAVRGSASAGRAVFGGFTRLPAGSDAAEPIHPADHWPDLRILAVAITERRKAVSSREGMTRSRDTSPYYRAWVEDSVRVAREVEEAVSNRDIERLGQAMRLSYLRMVGTMISADPPFLYWLPSTIAVLDRCEALRGRGLAAWETMDAGPQVKVLTVAEDADTVQEAILDAVPTATIYRAAPGPGVRTVTDARFREGRP